MPKYVNRAGHTVRKPDRSKAHFNCRHCRDNGQCYVTRDQILRNKVRAMGAKFWGSEFSNDGCLYVPCKWCSPDADMSDGTELTWVQVWNWANGKWITVQ